MESMNTSDVIIYDVLWNVLQLSDYIDIMSIRFVDKKSYELTTRMDLWSGLLNRDFIFLTEFDLRQANSNPEKGYNIIRKYIFRYVLTIQKEFNTISTQSSYFDVAKNLLSCFESIGITQFNIAPVQQVEPHDPSYLTTQLGLENQDLVQIQNGIKTSRETNSEFKIGQNTLQNAFTSFKNKNLGEKWSNNMNNDNLSMTSRKPTIVQQSIYNSLIEWREEYSSGISQEIGELIIEDILNVLNIRYGKIAMMKLTNILNNYINDLNYGIQLHILYNTNRPTINKKEGSVVKHNESSIEESYYIDTISD
jgi:hypothetical protein